MKGIVVASLSILLVLINHVTADNVEHITLIVQDQVISPACSPRLSLVINGTLPGPEIHINGGDHVHIRVWNHASVENITMHWHGLTQFGSPFSDGTPAASQWPIPPGKYFDYEFQFDDDLSGTFWYHSHVGVGLLTAHGALIVHQKDGSPYDTNSPIPYDEERLFLVGDLFNKVDGDLVLQAQNGSFIGGANAILVNGKNWAECNQTVLDGLGYGTQCDQACTYSNIEIEPDKTYLFRFVAASVDTFAGIAIQEHNMTLVQVDGGSWLEPFETNYLEMHSGQRYAVIIKGKSVEELSQSKKLTYYAKVVDYQNPPPPSTSSAASSISSAALTGTTNTGTAATATANAAAGPVGPGAGAPPGPPPVPPPDTYAIITYKFPGAPPVNPSIYNSPPSPDEVLPFLPDFTVGPQYGLISDTFKPLKPVVPPLATMQIHLTTSQDSWGGKERDVMNSLAYFPDPSFVPLLVGMYNGEITVDENSIARAAANNGFDNVTGAIVVDKNAVVDFVLKNQIGDLGLSVPHPFHMHGGDFWDMGGGSGAFDEEVWQAHLATMTPVRRDTTILGAIPGNGTYHDPEGWRVFRWQPKNPGVWMLHCHITGHMMLGLQTHVVVGTNKDLPPLPIDYKGAYLSYGQTAAMGGHDDEKDFIPYFITPSSPDPTANASTISKRWWNPMTWH